MDKQTALGAFEEAAYQSGGIYRERIMASARLAIVTDPNRWPEILASLRKWRPEYFSEKEANRRQRKDQEMKSQAAAKAAHRQPSLRQSASTSPLVSRKNRSCRDE
jgi:hypothetical protein